MKKKGINKEMHGVRAVRACKYDTKFYLISLPRDTTPKFIHRWFIHTISSLAFNRIPLSTRRICQLNNPKCSIRIGKYRALKAIARLHLRCKRSRKTKREGGRKATNLKFHSLFIFQAILVLIFFSCTHISIVFIFGLFNSFCVLKQLRSANWPKRRWFLPSQ